MTLVLLFLFLLSYVQDHEFLTGFLLAYICTGLVRAYVRR